MQEHKEEILVETPNRYALFPIKYPNLYDFYKKAQGAYWTAREIHLADDKPDWDKNLTEKEKYYIKNILAFFAGADGIVNENLVERLWREVQCPETKCFYTFQMAIESVHSEVYSMLIDACMDDPTERDSLFNAIQHNPAIKRKGTGGSSGYNPRRRLLRKG
ncbi:Ribonucleoside-diphosphate reductase subunit M2 B [Rhizophlyctis rosea]|nr:Ribonucleoside-diphosphate reductase subunit M2 B [Rhizophlyctis rosea]